MREIGSEFWLEDHVRTALDAADYDGVKPPQAVLSGRTAIDLILQHLLRERKITCVLMPSYCCQSMIQPFLDRNVDVAFYHVGWDEGITYSCLPTKADIILVCDYFGYDTALKFNKLEEWRQEGLVCEDAVVIYDKTHALFSENDNRMTQAADYVFASIRKWLGVPSGALVIKGLEDFFLTKTLRECPFVENKILAMRMKKRYIEGDKSTEKDTFLSLFGNFTRHLETDYRDYRMDELSARIWGVTECQHIIQRRRKNASILHEGLKDNRDFRLMNQLKDTDVPLFVPILLQNRRQREDLRAWLISNHIYCPVHWPKSGLIPSDLDEDCLYERELSLVCDQRYTDKDMIRMLHVIDEYYKH